VLFREEADATGSKVEDSADKSGAAFPGGTATFGSFEKLAHGPADIGFDGAGKLLGIGQVGVDGGQAGKNVFDEKLNAGVVVDGVELVIEGSLDGAASGMTENDKERRVEMGAGVLDAGHDFGGDNIAGDADDEEFAEIGIEDQFGRNTGIAATEDGGEGFLALGESSESFLAYGRKAGLAGNETLVASGESAQRLLSGCHGSQSGGAVGGAAEGCDWVCGL